MQVSFGDRIKSWRRRRGVSQLRLAVDAGLSARHLSFLETGRSRPSRVMVLRLAEELGVPPRQQDALLLAAGFAPALAEADPEPSANALRAAVARVLEAREPFPAVALDRARNIVASNRAAARLLARAAPELPGGPLNIYRLLLHPRGLAPRIANFEEYGGHLLARLERDAERSSEPVLLALLEEAEGYPGLPRAPRPSRQTGEVALTLRLRDDAGELAFVSTIETLGIPQEGGPPGIVVESLAPADARTEQLLRALA